MLCRYAVPASAADAFEEAVQEEAYGDLMQERYGTDTAPGSRAAYSHTSLQALQALSRRTTVVDPHCAAMQRAGV